MHHPSIRRSRWPHSLFSFPAPYAATTSSLPSSSARSLPYQIVNAPPKHPAANACRYLQFVTVSNTHTRAPEPSPLCTPPGPNHHYADFHSRELFPRTPVLYQTLLTLFYLANLALLSPTQTRLSRMLYPSRPLVSEPFVSQCEVIDRIRIELQNQPSLYFARPLSRPGKSPAPHQNPAVAGHYKLGYPRDFCGQYRSGGLASYDTSRVSGGAGVGVAGGAVPGVSVGNMKSLKSPVLVADRLAPHVLEPAGSVSSMGTVSQNHEVFGSNKLFGKTTGAGFVESREDAFCTFDPFASDSSSQLFQLSLFTSSSNIVGSNYSSNSTSIWGTSNKGINDAAVWG